MGKNKGLDNQNMMQKKKRISDILILPVLISYIDKVPTQFSYFQQSLFIPRHGDASSHSYLGT